jgi:hypothetical protein
MRILSQSWRNVSTLSKFKIGGQTFGTIIKITQHFSVVVDSTDADLKNKS